MLNTNVRAEMVYLVYVYNLSFYFYYFTEYFRGEGVLQS